jgi:hypothetical protein
MVFLFSYKAAQTSKLVGSGSAPLTNSPPYEAKYSRPTQLVILV